MKRLKYVLLGFMCAALVSCASGPLAKLPPIGPEVPKGEVVVIRSGDMLGALGSFIITLNGEDIFGLRYGQYTKFHLAAGEHFVGVKCFGGWLPTWGKRSLKMSLRPGGIDYFIVNASMDGVCCASISPIPELEAKELIPDREYVSMEQE